MLARLLGLLTHKGQVGYKCITLSLMAALPAVPRDLLVGPMWVLVPVLVDYFDH